MRDQKLAVYGAVIREGKALLLHRKEPDVWEFPGGNIKFGEHPQHAALREVKEETGLQVSVSGVLIGSIVRPDGVHEICLVYLCNPQTAQVRLGEPDHLEYGWFSLKDVKELKNLATSVRSVLDELSEVVGSAP
jgi:8-oxo-dGTP pyrophosphatase MutT (NUDIX family)